MEDNRIDAQEDALDNRPDPETTQSEADEIQADAVAAGDEPATGPEPAESEGKRSKKGIIIALIVVLLLVVAGIAGFLLLSAPKTDGADDHKPTHTYIPSTSGHRDGVGWDVNDMIGAADLGSTEDKGPSFPEISLPSIFPDTSSDSSESSSDAGKSSDSGSSASDGASSYESESITADSPGDSASDAASSLPASDPDVPAGTKSYSDDGGNPLVLTAGRWDDNKNWPFFTNLVNSGKIEFPSFGLDPRHRVKVTVLGDGDVVVAGEKVALLDVQDKVIWTARTNKDGHAYLFYKEGEEPAAVEVAGEKREVSAKKPDESGQGTDRESSANQDEVTVSIGGKARESDGLQVMFILDTTGSMGDELAYLQKDFSSIAREVGNDKVTWSANFYRDQGDDYVIQFHHFTDDVEYVSNLIMEQTAEGGGDAPEAVDRILYETLTNNDGWRDGSSKIAFLIFDAPPHKNDEAERKLDGAIRDAAEKGIKLVPVVASNADRETELFGRAIAIQTGAPYVFLTDDSEVGEGHMEPIIGDYDVKKLHDIIVEIINENR